MVICLVTLHAQDREANWRDDLKVFEAEFSGHPQEGFQAQAIVRGSMREVRGAVSEMTRAIDGCLEVRGCTGVNERWW